MRTDNGIAEVVFIPKRDTSLPAMIVELKWNESAESAVEKCCRADQKERLNHKIRLILYQNWKYSQPTDDLGSNGKTIPK